MPGEIWLTRVLMVHSPVRYLVGSFLEDKVIEEINLMLEARTSKEKQLSKDHGQLRE